MNNFYSLCRQNFTLADRFIIQPRFDAESSAQVSSWQRNRRTFRYADLDDNTGRMANYLRYMGLVKGDRLVVQVEKSPQNLFWYLACLRAGVIYVPLNTGYQASELAHFVQDSTPGLILCDPTKEAIFSALSRCPVKTLDAAGRFSDTLPAATDFEDVCCDKDTLAAILYTSGTTGKPKGAMLSHVNLANNALALSDAWRWSRDDVTLHTLPVFHTHGLFVAIHLSLLNSSTILWLDKFTPDRVVRCLPESTVYMGVPTNYTRLLDAQLLTPALCKKMRLFISGSAPLLAVTFEAFKVATGHSIVERYGMTETGMNTSNPLDGMRKPGTVGPPLAGVEIKIVDHAGESVPPQSPGDLYVRGEHVFKGYWQTASIPAGEFTQDGYFKTGDIASVDAEGYISIIGRSKDMIITGGLNVYPLEIESFLNDIDGVAESAVIGLPDEDFGEAVTAVIVTTPAARLTEADIKSAMKQNIAAFKVAKQVYFIAALPRNSMGKIQKNQLRLRYSQPCSVSKINRP